MYIYVVYVNYFCMHGLIERGACVPINHADHVHDLCGGHLAGNRGNLAHGNTAARATPSLLKLVLIEISCRLIQQNECSPRPPGWPAAGACWANTPGRV